jgi:hypothetical protein
VACFSRSFFFRFRGVCVGRYNKGSTKVQQRFNKGSKRIVVLGVRKRQGAQAIYIHAAADSGCLVSWEIASKEMVGVARGEHVGA